MPWREVSTLSLRWEFVELASQSGVAFSDLCQRFEISPKTGYKWVKRYQQQGVKGLVNRSRRPHHWPGRSAEAIEERFCRCGRNIRPGELAKLGLG
jgi:transposase-like protein